MKVDYYMQLQKIIAEENNVHQVYRFIAETELGDLKICFKTALGFYDWPDEIFLELGNKKLNNPKLLEKIINKLKI